MKFYADDPMFKIMSRLSFRDSPTYEPKLVAPPSFGDCGGMRQPMSYILSKCQSTQ